VDRAPEGLFRWRVDGIPGMREGFSRMEAEFCAQVQVRAPDPPSDVAESGAAAEQA